MPKSLKLLIAGYLVLPLLFALLVYSLPICPPQGDQPKAGESKKEASGAPITIEKDKGEKKGTPKNTQNQSGYTRIVSVLTGWSDKWLGEPIALWTYYIFGVTAGLAFYTYWLWQSTSDLVKGADKIAQHDLRAYVGIDDIFYQYISVPGSPHDRSPIDIPPRVAKPRPRLRVINYGKTPARGMVIRSWSAMATIKGEFEFVYRKRNHDVPRQVLDPAQPFGTTIPIDFTLVEFNPLRPLDSGTKVLFIYGSIVYGDIYDRWWFRHFCYYYDPVHFEDRGRLNRFIPHARYNDEEPKPYESADAALDTLKWSEAPYNA